MNKYIKVNYESHNISRTHCQLKPAQEMVEKFDEMNAIIKEITDKAKEKKHYNIGFAEKENVIK